MTVKIAAVTCGDGAYVGPYSNQLEHEWSQQVSGQPLADPMAESSCEFHILQHVGRVVDAKFTTGAEFDNLLRWFRDRSVARRIRFWSTT